MSNQTLSIEVRPASGGSWRPLNWTRVYIRKSLEEICHAIEIDVAPADRALVHKHASLYIEHRQTVAGVRIARPVSSGFIDNVKYSAQSSRKSLTVSARSPARDLVDSAWSPEPGEEVSGLTALKTFQQVVKRFRNIQGNQMQVYHIPIRDSKGTELDSTEIVPSFNWENESPWQKMLQIAETQGFILTSSQIGDLYITRVGGNRPEGFTIAEGQSAAVTRDEEDGAGQFRNYIFKAVDADGNSATKTYEDTTVPTGRILTVNLTEPIETEDQLKRRVETERRKRNSRRITVTLNDWGLPETQLKKLGNLSGKEIFWEVNYLTPVKLPSIGVETNLITEQVEYKADSTSMTCDVTLVNKEKYQ